jgi:hypothetical protein
MIVTRRTPVFNLRQRLPPAHQVDQAFRRRHAVADQSFSRTSTVRILGRPRVIRLKSG